MNRGSDGHVCVSCDPGRRFNEAPIHESGKYGLFRFASQPWLTLQ